MSVRVEVICVNPDGSGQRREVVTVECRELTMETLGMNLREGKTLLTRVQDLVVAQQACEDLERRRACPHCRARYTTKDSGSTTVTTVFVAGRQTSPEMLYLETKWASLIPFARVADLLREVLPVEDSVNQETVRNHLYGIAERIEQELGEERQLNLFEGTEEDWEQQPMADGADHRRH